LGAPGGGGFLLGTGLALGLFFFLLATIVPNGPRYGIGLIYLMSRASRFSHP